MATIKVMLDKRRDPKNGCYPLVIRVYSGTKRSDIGLKTYLKETQFDEGSQQVNRSHPNYKVINSKIKETSLKLESSTLKLQMKEEEDVTAEKIKASVVKTAVKVNFIEYGERIVKQMRAANRIGNALAYEGALNALKTYSGKSNPLFTDISYELLLNMENKMTVAGLKRNSIASYNRSFRAVFNRAINENLVDSKYYPYKRYKIKGEKTAKRNISKADIEAIVKLALEHDSPLWHARSYFMLSFNLRGISFADMASIKPCDIVNGRLEYTRKKTRKHYNIKLTDVAKEILAYYQKPNRTYILPVIAESIANNPDKERKAIIQAIKTCNKYLKSIGKTAEIQKLLTTYVSRFSWANIAKSMGYSKDLIAEGLGHEFGNPVTGIYLDAFDQDVIDDMNEAICKF